MFYVAIAAGILFCSYWIAQLVFVILHLKWTNKTVKSTEEDEDAGVSIIHPIKDLDFELDKNLEKWACQYYSGPIQHIFSFQNPNDPAIPVICSFLEKHPELDAQITINPVIRGLNGKSSNMVNALKLAKYGFVLFGDSDIRIKPDFIIKMIRPLKNQKVGITTCGQINKGGRDFWTRFFTFLQNSETDFMWAFFAKIGMDVGATGAAFAMRKQLLKDIGGLEAFGGSLLEDLHLGNKLYRMGYKVVVGPFVECRVTKLDKEKSCNYAKRLGIGIKTHIVYELPLFVLMQTWYWELLILSVILWDVAAIYLTLCFFGFRILHGLVMRIVTGNRIWLSDIVIALFYDLFGAFYLLYSYKNPDITWRGIKYKLKEGGFIGEMAIEDDMVKEKAGRV